MLGDFLPRVGQILKGVYLGKQRKERGICEKTNCRYHSDFVAGRCRNHRRCSYSPWTANTNTGLCWQPTSRAPWLDPHRRNGGANNQSAGP